MPGFVNAHSHLEYTSFRGMFDDQQFGDWIISLIDVKASLTPDEYLWSARLGALEALASGVTTIADTTYTGETLTPPPKPACAGWPISRSSASTTSASTRPSPTSTSASRGRRRWRARASRSASPRTRPTRSRAACSRPSPASPASAT